MLNLIQNEILFFLSVAFLMFLPGYCLVLAIFGKNSALSALERFIVSFGLSIISVDFILFAYSGLHIVITRLSIILGVLAFSSVCLAIYKFYVIASEAKQSRNNNEIAASPLAPRNDSKLFSFSKNQFILILLLLFLIVFIKTAYLSTAIAPTATDLGHHLYWAKTIAETHSLTDYEGMSDFIIGEHTIFASINILTGLSFFTGWPVVILNLINLLGILTVFILTLRIFQNLPPHQNLSTTNSNLNNYQFWCGGKMVAILTLLFLGVLFAVSSPQSKYVSGGVMGNIFGNFLMPLAFYFYYRAFSFLENKEFKPEKNNILFLSLAVFTTFGLFYTHHLTSFIFLFIFILAIPLFLIINYKEVEIVLKKSAKIVFSPAVLITFVLGIIFFFFVFTPTYVNTKAVDTAVGTAVKSTRVGLSITNLKNTVGEPRIALGFLGFLLLVAIFRRKNFGYALLASWAFMIFMMSSFPNLLLVDLPSNRIGNYLTYPLAILSAFGFYTAFRPESCRLFFGKKICENSKGLISDQLLKGTFLLIFTFVVASGLSDSAQAFKKQNSLKETNQTFDASRYLSENSDSSDIILKDHNYITGDAWMKLFFMRGYKYPQSRGFFSRYEEQGSRSGDLCTLVMISNPGSTEAQKCFSETKTNFIMVNPKFDSPQFQKLSGFDQIYMSDEVAIYYKK